MSNSIRALLGESRIVPVLSPASVNEALDAGEALMAGGLRVLEVTLRTPVALACISALVERFPDACIGAGTVLDGERLFAARAAGAAFGVSPGLTPSLAAAVREAGIPFLPGAATVSEMMRAGELGFDTLKFFPAESLGGARYLGSLQSVLPDVAFCATGGIDVGNAAAYLALGNVAAIGGSWMIVRDAGGSVDARATCAAAARALALCY